MAANLRLLCVLIVLAAVCWEANSKNTEKYLSSKMSDEGKLFVDGLSLGTEEASLFDAFSKYGSITKVVVVRDRESNRPRGFGFVTFEYPEDAKDALLGMNGKTVDGKPIGVRGRGFSRGGESRGGGGRSYSGDRGFGGDRG